MKSNKKPFVLLEVLVPTLVTKDPCFFLGARRELFLVLTLRRVLTIMTSMRCFPRKMVCSAELIIMRRSSKSKVQLMKIIGDMGSGWRCSKWMGGVTCQRPLSPRKNESKRYEVRRFLDIASYENSDLHPSKRAKLTKSRKTRKKSQRGFRHSVR